MGAVHHGGSGGDTVIEAQFEDDCGNVYKPTGDGATLAEGTFNEEDFDKETNQALSSNLGGGGDRRVLALDLESVSDQWPLIRYLMDDPVYEAQYVADVREAAEEVFNPERMSEIYAYYAALIEPYVAQEEGSTASFEGEIEALIQHVEARYEAALAFVESQRPFAVSRCFGTRGFDMLGSPLFVCGPRLKF